MNADWTRRNFLKVSAGFGAGLMLGCRLDAKTMKPAAKGDLGVFVQIDTNGKVTIFAPRPDCGQGVRTSLAMIVAEELGADWTKVEVQQAPGNREKYGPQGVGGSATIRGSYGPLRIAGATAALMLRQAAAARFGCSVEDCTIDAGTVNAAGKTATFGELAEAAAKLPVPDRKQVQVKNRAEFKIIGKPTRRVDNQDVVTGKAVFGLDIRVPGMKVATIERPNAFGASAESFDDSEAKKVPGFDRCIKLGSGIAVVADSTWHALKARQELKVTWSGGNSLNEADLTKRFQQATIAFPEMPSGVSQVIEAVYQLPYLSHATMEPMNCTAHVKADSCEVWAPTQIPDSLRDMVARQLQIAPDNVAIHVPLVGGGFGRRFASDVVNEAVSLSKTVGAPVQVLWTRADDMRHDNYRPMNYHAFKGAVGANGKPIAFYHQLMEAGGRGGGDSFGQLRFRYNIPNGGVRQGGIDSPIPTGAWRSVENTYLNFVQESFFDELCHAGKQDPLELRLELCGDDRMKRLLRMAADKANWGQALPKGRGRGIACFSGYGSAIAQVAEVEVKGDQIKVVKMTAVVDCGLAINPLGVQAQVEGAVMDAIATTLYSKCTLEDGGMAESHYGDFGWSHMKDTPEFDITVIGDGETPGGMGEVGYPATPPAIVNAIFAATGKRHRVLPILG